MDEEFNLSNKIENGWVIHIDNIKKFINKQLDNISKEQAIVKGTDWKRSLLKLKADLEVDSGGLY